MSANLTPRRGPGRPRGAVTGQTRETALDVATRLFGTSGYRGTSLGEVAHQAGLSNAGLLHHFPSKEQLLIEVLRRRDEVDLKALALDRSAAEATVWDRLDALVNLARLNSGRPGIVKLYTTLSGEAIDGDHPAHGWLREHLAQAIGGLAEAFETGKVAGIVRPEAPSASIARSCVALLDGLQIQWLAALGSAAQGTAGAPYEIDEMSWDVEVFVDGLRKLWQLPAP